MKNAVIFSRTFPKTIQCGRLYIVTSAAMSSAPLGHQFRIYVLPKDEDGIWNGAYNPPLNENAVQVYGLVSTGVDYKETYGWLHHGPWQKDFKNLCDKIADAEHEAKRIQDLVRLQNEIRQKERINVLLSDYDEDM